MVTLLIFYGSILFCFIVAVVRLFAYVKAPVHLRWELFRETPAYTSPATNRTPTVRPLSKILLIVGDVLTLRGYLKGRGFFWIPLFWFHWGIYLLILWHIWIFAVPIIGKTEVNTEWGLAWGHAATALAFIGALGVLIQRLTDKEMRISYPLIHYVKWVLMLITLGVGFFAVYSYMGNSMSHVVNYVDGQLQFNWSEKIHAPVETSLHVVLVSFWLLYAPFSHMMRLVFRYYHELRWDSAFRSAGGKLEREMRKNLNRKATWSAPHAEAGKTWANLAETYTVREMEHINEK